MTRREFRSILTLFFVAASALFGAALPTMPVTRAVAGEPLLNTLTGIDVLRRDGFNALSGQRVGLITNHTGRSRDGESTVSLLYGDERVNLTALFSPEHGFKGELDVARIGDTTDSESGLQVFSLYGKTRRPTSEMLSNVDTLVFDIQDIGTRFYTYISTMGEAMKAADEHGKRFVVLDRPNPIAGTTVSGPMLDSGTESFVGFHSLPVRHGMTTGELARMFKSELGLSLQLDVIECEGWDRELHWDETGLVWVNPSPNMRSLTQALLYPGIGLLETSNLSVGRGTDTPFEIVGAPWIDPVRLTRRLHAMGVPGVTFVPIRFTPDSSKYKGEVCGGVNFVIVRRDRFDPLRLGLSLAVALNDVYPRQWKAADSYRLLGNRETLDAIRMGAQIDQVRSIARRGIDAFLKRRNAFLIYH